MAQFKTRYNKNKTVKDWLTSAKINGVTVNVTYSAKVFKERDARRRHYVIEELERVSKLGRQPNAETLDELDKLSDLVAKLKDKGVLKCPATVTLKELCDKFMEYNEIQKMAPSTIEQRLATTRKLYAFFGDGCKVENITKMDAQRFDAELARLVKVKENGGAGIAPAHRSGIIKRIKTIFNWGVENELITTNPFKSVKAGKQTNRARQFYISPKETLQILDACAHTNNGTEWAARCALARYQGLRVPSEDRALRWRDVDFEKKTIHITAQKTKNTRDMPLFDETAAILKRLRDEQKRAGTFDDSPYVLRKIRMVTNPGTTFKKIVFRAGVEDYPKPFQNLRASAATDVRDEFGAQAESLWIGHGTAIAEGHYLMVTPETWERAKARGLTGQTPKVEANAFDTAPDFLEK